MKRIISISLIVATIMILASCAGGGSFEIAGKWKNTGDDGFGQAQPGSIVVFDGTNCNLWSPQDTYAFYKDGNHYTLDITGFLFGDNMSFTVEVKDKDHIEIIDDSWTLELTRVQ